MTRLPSGHSRPMPRRAPGRGRGTATDRTSRRASGRRARQDPPARSRRRGRAARDRRGSGRPPAPAKQSGAIRKGLPHLVRRSISTVLLWTCAYSNVSRSSGSCFRLMTVSIDSLLLGSACPTPALLFLLRPAGRRRGRLSGKSGAKRARSAAAPRSTRSSLKSPPTGTITVAGYARARAAPGEAFGGERAVLVYCRGAIARRPTPAGGAKAPRLPADSAAAARISGTAVNQREHRLDALADDERSIVVGSDGAEAHREAVDRGRAPCAGSRGPPWRASADRARCAGRRAMAPSTPVTAATSAGRRRTVAPSR